MRATLEESFYNVSVTSAEMWQAVGKVLASKRLDRRWRPIDIQRAGGPSYKTVQAIDAGDVGTVESLEKYAGALKLSIVDILHSVLESRLTPLTPEAAHVVRKFAETTVDGRTAILAVANAVPPAAQTTGIPPIPGAAGTPTTPRPPRPGPQVTKRRTAR